MRLGKWLEELLGGQQGAVGVVVLGAFGAAETYEETGTLETPGQPIDWLEFTFFNTITLDSLETDLYIRSIEITGDATATADFDDDNDVDGSDFLTWQRGVRTAGGMRGIGDADADGDVDGADLTVWKQQFGQPAAEGAAAAIPEPSTLAAVVGAAVVGSATTLLRRRT